jgi:hypothetical protein
MLVDGLQIKALTSARRLYRLLDPITSLMTIRCSAAQGNSEGPLAFARTSKGERTPWVRMDSAPSSFKAASSKMRRGLVFDSLRSESET